MELLPDMLAEQGDGHLASDPDAALELRESLCSSSIWRNVGGKISMCRFMGAVRRSLEEDRLWSRRLYGLTHAAIHLDFQPSKSTLKVINESAKKLADKPPADPQKESLLAAAKRDLSALRASAKNALHMAFLTFSDKEHKFRQRVIHTVSKPTSDWQGESNVRLRDVFEAERWLVEQCLGKVYDHILNTLRIFMDRDAHEYMGFFRDFDERDHAEPTARSAQSAHYDALAESFAKMCLGLVGLRLQRCLPYTHGWPLRCCLFTTSRAEQAVTELRARSAAYKYTKLKSGTLAKRLLRRSPFATRPGQQVDLVLSQANDEVTPEVVEWCHLRSRRFLQTQLAEDGFNVTKRVAGKGKWADVPSPKLWQGLVESPLLEGRHRYEQIDPSIGKRDIPRGVAFGAEVYRPVEKQTWPELRRLKGLEQRTAWYSPPGAQLDESLLDHLIVSAARRHGWDSWDAGWCNTLLARSDALVVRDTTGQELGGQWFFPLKGLNSELTLVWPAEAHVLEGTSQQYFSPKLSNACRQTFAVGMWKVDDFEAIYGEWLSPFSQMLRWPDSEDTSSRLARVRFVPKSAVVGAAPFLSLCARRAFFDLPQTSIMEICNKTGAPTRAGSFYALLEGLIRHVLGCCAAEATDILHLRCIDDMTKACEIEVD